VSSLHNTPTGATASRVNTQDADTWGADYAGDGEWTERDIEEARRSFYEDGAPSVTISGAMALDPRISASLFRLLSVMSLFAAGDVLILSQKELADRIGVSQQAVSKSLAQAEAEGYVNKTTVGTKKTWRLRWLWNHDHRPQPPVVPDPQPPVVDSSDSQPTVVAHDAHALSLSSTSTTTGVRTKRTKKIVIATLTEEQTARVHAAYDGLLGAAMVTNQIALALDYASVKRAYTDHYRMVMNWLVETVRRAELHSARMETEKARLERARTPYRPAVQEPKPFLGRNIRDIVGPAPEGYEDRFMKENHFGESAG
jgi:hypothetical protein